MATPHLSTNSPASSPAPAAPSLFDAHCHLQDDRLAPALEAVMDRARGAGVAACMCCGSEEADWDAVRRLAGRFPAVRLSFGVHPWQVRHCTANWMATLRALLRDHPAAGVGEIGLDHALDKDTFARQEEVFLAQLALAAELRRPVSAHCRRAWGRMMELLDSRGWPPGGILFHSYSGGRDLVAPLVRRGAWFSFSGAITHDANRRGKEAAASVPDDRLLIETDAPDLLPAPPDSAAVPGAPGVNEPANLVHIAAAVARLRGWSPAQAATITTRNATAFFGPSP